MTTILLLSSAILALAGLIWIVWIIWDHLVGTIRAEMPFVGRVDVHEGEEPEWFPNEGDRQYWREKHGRKL